MRSIIPIEVPAVTSAASARVDRALTIISGRGTPAPAPARTPLEEVCDRFEAGALDVDQLADAILADGFVQRRAAEAEAKAPGGAAALLRVDRVVQHVADPSLRLLVAITILGKIERVAGDLDGPAWQQCPAFHAYVTLAGIESNLGNEAASEAWLIRLAELEPCADGSR